VALGVAWNALMLLANALNGWAHKFTDPWSLRVLGIACLAMFSFALGVLISDGFRSVAFHPRRAHLYHAAPYLLIAAITLLLGGGAFVASFR
jgi:hypothetical protein